MSSGSPRRGGGQLFSPLGSHMEMLGASPDT